MKIEWKKFWCVNWKKQTFTKTGVPIDTVMLCYMHTYVTIEQRIESYQIGASLNRSLNFESILIFIVIYKSSILLVVSLYKFFIISTRWIKEPLSFSIFHRIHYQTVDIIIICTLWWVYIYYVIRYNVLCYKLCAFINCIICIQYFHQSHALLKLPLLINIIYLYTIYIT